MAENNFIDIKAAKHLIIDSLARVATGGPLAWSRVTPEGKEIVYQMVEAVLKEIVLGRDEAEDIGTRLQT